MGLNEVMNKESLHADVVIIGGGVIGCAIAYNLAKAQIKTLVIDKADNVGREASWGGCGYLGISRINARTVCRTLPCELGTLSGIGRGVASGNADRY